MPTLELKPTHKVVAAYYDNLAKFAKLGIKHEGAVRSAFQELLESCARQFDWKLVPEYAIKRKGQADAKADGALLDNYGLNHGLWEAKDSADDLEKEIKHKFALGYPKQNILFWQPDRAVLYQNGLPRERFEARARRPGAAARARRPARARLRLLQLQPEREDRACRLRAVDGTAAQRRRQRAVAAA